VTCSPGRPVSGLTLAEIPASLGNTVNLKLPFASPTPWPIVESSATAHRIDSSPALAVSETRSTTDPPAADTWQSSGALPSNCAVQPTIRQAGSLEVNDAVTASPGLPAFGLTTTETSSWRPWAAGDDALASLLLDHED